MEHCLEAHWWLASGVGLGWVIIVTAIDGPQVLCKEVVKGLNGAKKVCV